MIQENRPKIKQYRRLNQAKYEFSYKTSGFSRNGPQIPMPNVDQQSHQVLFMKLVASAKLARDRYLVGTRPAVLIPSLSTLTISHRYFSFALYSVQFHVRIEAEKTSSTETHVQKSHSSKGKVYPQQLKNTCPGF